MRPDLTTVSGGGGECTLADGLVEDHEVGVEPLHPELVPEVWGGRGGEEEGVQGGGSSGRGGEVRQAHFPRTQAGFEIPHPRPLACLTTHAHRPGSPAPEISAIVSHTHFSGGGATCLIHHDVPTHRSTGGRSPGPPHAALAAPTAGVLGVTPPPGGGGRRVAASGGRTLRGGPRGPARTSVRSKPMLRADRPSPES